MSEHLIENVEGFTVEQGRKLRKGMNDALHGALIDPEEADYASFSGLAMPDEEDRHVVAAAVAAEADLLCTNNVRHFPQPVMERVGIALVTADELITELVEEYPKEMVSILPTVVKRHPTATTAST